MDQHVTKGVPSKGLYLLLPVAAPVPGNPQLWNGGPVRSRDSVEGCRDSATVGVCGATSFRALQLSPRFYNDRIVQPSYVTTVVARVRGQHGRHGFM